jgi:hypothetical protein
MLVTLLYPEMGGATQCMHIPGVVDMSCLMWCHNMAIEMRVRCLNSVCLSTNNLFTSRPVCRYCDYYVYRHIIRS